MAEPLYRRTYDAAVLLRDHQPRFRHPHKATLFEIAYPGGTAPPGRPVEVTRWAEHVSAAVSFPPIAVEVRPDFYDYQPTAGVDWHVNFADPRVFAFYGSGLFAQDEMQVAEHPVLAGVREALVAEGLAARTTDDTGATPVLIRGVERRIAVDTGPAPGRPSGLYGNRFAAAPIAAVRQATRRVDPPTLSNIIAIAAPSGGVGEYTRSEIGSVFANAYTAFAAAVAESAGAAVAVHTGFWGCGAFGGNRRLMTALQALAARAAGVDRFVFHAGGAAGVDDARHGLDVADAIAEQCGSPGPPDSVALNAAAMGFRWGVSDGN